MNMGGFPETICASAGVQGSGTIPIRPPNLVEQHIARNSDTTMNRLTDEDLDQLKRLDREATPAPWYQGPQQFAQYLGSGYIIIPLKNYGYCQLGKVNVNLPECMKNAQLIVYIRNKLPALLAEIEQGRKAIEIVASVENWCALAPNSKPKGR
jgi:hypothetical protein